MHVKRLSKRKDFFNFILCICAVEIISLLVSFRNSRDKLSAFFLCVETAFTFTFILFQLSEFKEYDHFD